MARQQEDPQASEAHVSQAYTPGIAPPSQAINQSPAMPSAVAPSPSIVSQSPAGSAVAPPPPIGGQSTAASGSSRPLLCCDEPGYDTGPAHGPAHGSAHDYDQPSSAHKYNPPPLLKLPHVHQPPPMDKYEPLPPQPKYDLHQPRPDDDEALVYAPSVGAEQLGEPPPPMPEPPMPLGYFSHYALDTHGSLDAHDSLDYSVLDALLEGASYPQPGESSGSHEHYHDYPHY
nr:leucine-rich repeat extensin-like protein 3 [Penaeus vannamei]